MSAILADKLLAEVDSLGDSGPVEARTVLIPVPSAQTRLRERGFSPAAEIALGLGKRLKLPVDVFGLNRRGKFVAQSLMPDRRAREKNVRGAFAPGRGLKGRIPRAVILVDDVVTTGATAYACARTLANHGVRGITIAGVCRA